MASVNAPTQDSMCNPSPSSQQPIDGSPQNMSADEIPTPIESNQMNCTGESEETLTLGRKRSLTSVVWNHFKREKIDDKWKAICNFCNKKLGGDTKNGTKHLHDHFKICPLRKTRDIRQSFFMPKTDSLGTYTFNEEVVRKEMASMIILHEYPLNMVEHFGFRRFVASLQPLCKVVSRNTVKSDIMKIYDFEKDKIMKVFDKKSSKFAITTDMWTANNQKKGYMAITAHFIDESWKLQSRLVRFIYVPCPHTSAVICDALVDCLMDWNLDHKLSTLTLDNCSTNDALINDILRKLDKKAFWLDGSLLHMRCCAHILNLIVRDGLDVIGNGIGRIRSSVAFWVATPKRCEKFKETVFQIKVQCSRNLILDCKTRWNSTYKMLDVAICYKDVFNRLKRREPLYTSVPTEEDWENAKDICAKLKLFNNVTELFSGTEYPTANLYFPKICEIRLALRRWINSEKPTIVDMATKMLEKFEKYWSQINGIMGVATVLDPRYKLKLLHYYFPLLYSSEDAKKEIERIKEICVDLVNEYSVKFRASGGIGGSFQYVESSVTNPDEVDSMSNYDKFVASETEHETFKTELDTYLEERVLPRNVNVEFDILSWWKNSLKYPILQMVARDVLAIPISTVAFESAFSTSGRFVSPHRSRLHHDTLEALMCSQDWLWAASKGIGASATTRSECSTVLDDVDNEEGEEVPELDMDAFETEL
ncbi:hypothetical protein ACS0TY_030221 [Phlomoides rotata]